MLPQVFLTVMVNSWFCDSVSKKRETDVLSNLQYRYHTSIPCEYMLIWIAQRLIRQTWNCRAVLLVTGGFVYIQSFTMTSFALTSGTVRNLRMIRVLVSYYNSLVCSTTTALTPWPKSTGDKVKELVIASYYCSDLPITLDYGLPPAVAFLWCFDWKHDIYRENVFC